MKDFDDQSSRNFVRQNATNLEIGLWSIGIDLDGLLQCDHQEFDPFVFHCFGWEEDNELVLIERVKVAGWKALEKFFR